MSIEYSVAYSAENVYLYTTEYRKNKSKWGPKYRRVNVETIEIVNLEMVSISPVYMNDIDPIFKTISD